MNNLLLISGKLAIRRSLASLTHITSLEVILPSVCNLPSVCSVKSAFYTDRFHMSQLCNMIVLAARLMETLFGRQIVLSMHQKIVKENSRCAKVDYF